MARANKRAYDKSINDEFEKLAESPPPPSLLALTLNAFYWVDDSLQNLLKKNGWPGITRLQSQVLTSLGDGLLRTADIARHMGVSRQVVSRSVKELVDLDFLELVEDPDDKRAKVIIPTEQGKRIIVCATESLATIEEELEARIGARNLQKLRSLMEMPRGNPLK
ncbi:MarR family transcriptional regulator [Halioglobus maricola]|uniref:MarR family transcriptional regulator n=1 Tax=Halioglobus maricola TaxID=2601894 RepID=A0A5P9NIP1_9GAMM|nr:MarR family transcriptional regulator [Halioglobus maricola]QFU75396.1 MarR family transcriptional regulator [Halioglobus maricola]